MEEEKRWCFLFLPLQGFSIDLSRFIQVTLPPPTSMLLYVKQRARFLCLTTFTTLFCTVPWAPSRLCLAEEGAFLYYWYWA